MEYGIKSKKATEKSQAAEIIIICKCEKD